MVWLRKLGVLALGTGLVCGGALTTGCGGDTDSTGADPARTRPPSRRSGAGGRETTSPTIDLAKLLTEVPEYQGIGRNLFVFGQERAAVVAPPPPGSTPTATTTVPQAPPRGGQRPTRIDLKFAGFVEKTEPGGANKKYAVLLDGEEILTGAEGDLVGNRYKIIEIGLESVTVALEGSPFTQKIPLRTN